MDGFTLLKRQLRVAWASNPNATMTTGPAPVGNSSSDAIKDAVERIQVQP